MPSHKFLLTQISYGIGCLYDGRSRLTYWVTSLEVPRGACTIGVAIAYRLDVHGWILTSFGLRLASDTSLPEPADLSFPVCVDV